MIDSSIEIKAGDKILNVFFYKTTIKTLLRKPHKFKQMLLINDIEKVFESAVFLKSKPEGKGRVDKYSEWFYFEIQLNNEASWLQIVELKNGEYRLHYIGNNKLR